MKEEIFGCIVIVMTMCSLMAGMWIGYDSGYNHGKFDEISIAYNQGYADGYNQSELFYGQVEYPSTEIRWEHYNSSGILSNFNNCTEVDKNNTDLVMRLSCKGV